MTENKMIQTLNDPRSGLNNSQKKVALANSVKQVVEEVLGDSYNYVSMINALTDEGFNTDPKVRIVANGDINYYLLDEDGEGAVILSLNPKLLNLDNLIDLRIAVGAALKRTQNLNPTEALQATNVMVNKYSNSVVIAYSEASESKRDFMIESISTNVFNYLRNKTPDAVSNYQDQTVFREAWVKAIGGYVHQENDVNAYINRYTHALFEIIYGPLAADARIFHGHYKTVAAATDRTHNGGVDIRTGTDEFFSTYMMLCLQD